MMGDGPKYLRPGSLVIDIREPARVFRVTRRVPPLPPHLRLTISNLNTGRVKRHPGLKRYFVEDIHTGERFEKPGMVLQRTKA